LVVTTPSKQSADGFLRNNYRRGEPLATACDSRTNRRVSNILMDCEGVGIRIVKDLTREGRGWKWIWDPLPGTDQGVDATETLFMVYGPTTIEGGAYATFADVLAAVQAGLDFGDIASAVAEEVQHGAIDFTSGANTEAKEDNTDHDYRYPILGSTYANVYFGTIGRGTGTKSDATPTLAISATDSLLVNDAGLYVADWDALALFDATADSDGYGRTSLNWKNRELWNDDDEVTVNWQECRLYSPSYTNPTLDWDAGFRGIEIEGDVKIVSSNYKLYINSVGVVGTQGAAVADATGGATVDAEARTAINDLLARLRDHGLIAT
jgi:hypothetical protein